ncbi:hypothetical protein Tco_0120861 [Tanacetum coccineum]
MSQSQSSAQLLIIEQLVPMEFQIPIGKLNSKDVLPTLTCPKPCKIIGEILKDHSLRSALTLSAPAPIIYMQQLYTQKSFVQPIEYLTIQKVLKIIGYEAEATSATKFLVKHLTQPWQTFFKILNLCKTIQMPSHAILLQNDDPLLIMFTTDNSVNAIAMRILDELLTEYIKKIEGYKAYDDYSGLEVPTTQSTPVVSTQRMNRTISTPRMPKTKRTSPKKKEKVIGESSEPRKPLRIKLITKRPDRLISIPTYTKIEKEHLTKAEQISLVEAESAKEAKAKENIASVKKAIIAEEVDKMVDGEEEDGGFVDSLILGQEDPRTRLEPWSYKESLNDKKDDDDALIRRTHKGSSETQKAEKQHFFHKRDHDDRPDDGAPPEGEKGAKKQKTSRGSNDEDEIILEEASPEFLEDLKTPFPEEEVEEHLIRWHIKERSDPKEVYSDYKIVKVIIIKNEKEYGQDFIEEIIVKMIDNKSYIFIKADYKYLNKDDIEDMYYLCLKGKVNYHENGLLNSLVVFIKSCIIWERVHDYQLGIESCQIKINLTAPTLITPGIKNFELYSIITDPFIRIMYENSKKEMLGIIFELIRQNKNETYGLNLALWNSTSWASHNMMIKDLLNKWGKKKCSKAHDGNIAYLSDFKEFDRGYVAFGEGAYGGRITGKGTLKTDNLDFKDVYFVNELKFNLFSVSQMCDKKNYVLFTNTECLVLSPNFKLPDENQTS